MLYLSVPKEHLRPVNHRVLLFVEIGARVESTCPVDALARVHVRTRERLVCFLATRPGIFAHLSISTTKANVTQEAVSLRVEKGSVGRECVGVLLRSGAE